MQSAQVRSLVGGLRSHMLRGTAKNFFKNLKMKLHLFLKDLLMGRLTTFVVCIPPNRKESEEFLFESSGFASFKKKKKTQ